MQIQPVILSVILQFIIITTTALALHITRPTLLLQDHNVTADTTTLHLQPTNLTDRYSVKCELKIFPTSIVLSPSDCLHAIPYMCDWLSSLQPGTRLTEKWLWVSRPHCSLGYYQPINYQYRPQGVPSQEECRSDIYGMIIRRCAFSSEYDAGGINVKDWPSGHYPGVAWNDQYPRYIMAPKELTYFHRGHSS